MTTIPESNFEKKRLKILFRQHQISLPGNLLVATCVVALFYRQIPVNLLASWFLAIATVLLARFLIYHRYKAQTESTLLPSPWFVKCAVSTIANAILWGAFGVYASGNVPLIYFSIALLILAGLVAAAAATNSVSIPIFFGFALPIIIPVCISLFMSAEFERIVLGVLTLGFLGVMTQSALQLNKVVLTSLHYRYEKLQLLDDLQKEQIQSKNLNRRLALDIERREQTEKEKERLINQLQKALDEVKTSSGLIPICAHCKKVRDDKGYWNQIESYIHERSEADFSHGICPDCASELYPDMDLYNNDDK